jgi:non-ribosomal peptide synthetase component F
MVGPLINTLPMRVRLEGAQSVGAWLRGVQQQAAELRQYEYSPLVKIQGASAVGPGVPLFEYLYVFENYPLDASVAAGAGLSFELQELAGLEQVNYPLALMALPQGERLGLRVIYATDRFAAWGVRQLLGHVERVLEAFVAAPEGRLSAIEVLAPGEREQVLVTWNTTARAYPSDRCIHELVEAQVEQRPEAVAVVCGEEALTYAELNARANQLARHLRSLGVGPESLVGICLERSPEMIVGLLGILKAGGAYVPLDPAYPAERLAFM